MEKKIFHRDQASFSKCGLYRWWLERDISLAEKKLLFIGLNPSLADQEVNDPTTTRLMNFASSWNYGTLLIINLFARISSNPTLLKKISDPVGSMNNIEILSRLNCWERNQNWDLWLGWGSKGCIGNRNKYIINILRSSSKRRIKKFDKAKGPLVIGLTKKGNPMHPLYVSSKKILRPLDIMR